MAEAFVWALFFVAMALALWGWIRAQTLKTAFFVEKERSSRVGELEGQLSAKEGVCFALRKEVAVLEEKVRLLQEAKESLTATFKALSAEALQKNNESFVSLAKATFEKFHEGAKGDLEKRQQSFKELVSPVKESLGKLDEGLRKLEKERKGEQEALKTQLRALVQAEKDLKGETSSLVKALRAPITRGRWGEVQLKRVVELSGMVNQCDFFEQEMFEEGKMRPDLIVRLPGGRQVIIDAKVPLTSYLESVEAKAEEEKEAYLKDHARQVKLHVQALSKKGYWEGVGATPEFVVLFLPSESIFSAALQYDPTLIEVGAEQGVVIATPTTLIALLRSVAYGWKQENLSRHLERVSDLGHDLYKRIVDMSSHFTKMGRGLSTAVDAYNKGVGSLEARVLPIARKFQELGAASTQIDLDPLEVIEKTPRLLQAPEFTSAATVDSGAAE